MRSPEDVIVRMRLNIGLIVDRFDPQRGADERFPERVNALVKRGRLSRPIGEAMKRINAVRNLVLHEFVIIGRDIRAEDWQEILDSYSAIMQWIRPQPILNQLPLRLIPQG